MCTPAATVVAVALPAWQQVCMGCGAAGADVGIGVGVWVMAVAPAALGIRASLPPATLQPLTFAALSSHAMLPSLSHPSGPSRPPQPLPSEVMSLSSDSLSASGSGGNGGGGGAACVVAGVYRLWGCTCRCRLLNGCVGGSSARIL